MDHLKHLILDNISAVVFIAFVLFGLLSRGNGQKETSNRPAERPTTPQPTMARGQKSVPQQVDNRPLAERLAEAFGVDMTELRPQPTTQTDRPRSSRPSEGRRSTSTHNVQDDYPDLFGGPGLFQKDGFTREETKWGFDETEWGSTFEKNDEQWGGFPDRKSSEPRIEWPS